MLGLHPAGRKVRASATPRSPAAPGQARRRAGSSSSTCWTPINAAGRGRQLPSRGARWSVPAPPTTFARSMPTPKPGGAGTTKRSHLIPDGSSRTQDAQASVARSATRRLRDSPPGGRRHRMSGRKESHHMTTIAPEHRTTLGRHLRELQVILASAPACAAVVFACTVPAATCGPPQHVHAACDEIFFIVSGKLLVLSADGHVAMIREGGLVHISCGMPHTFATTPDAPARFLVLYTAGGSGESGIAAGRGAAARRPAAARRHHAFPGFGWQPPPTGTSVNRLRPALSDQRRSRPRHYVWPGQPQQRLAAGSRPTVGPQSPASDGK